MAARGWAGVLVLANVTLLWTATVLNLPPRYRLLTTPGRPDEAGRAAGPGRACGPSR